MTYRAVDVVEVVAWGRTVGATAYDDASRCYAFEYDDDWAEGSVELAPLYLPNGPGPVVFPDLNPDTYQRLAPLLADALPDRFGNALVNAWMARHGIDPATITPLDRLAYTANRAMGALEFRPPADAPITAPTAIALADLVTAARDALRGTLADGPEAEQALDQLISVGTSAGGARAKAVIAYNPTTGQIRSGQLDAPDGFEHWLVKFDGVGDDPTRETLVGEGRAYGIIEFAYHLMARAAGIDMTECRLLPEGPRVHFLTRRFDRYGAAGRHHLLSLCGLAHLDFNQAAVHGYEQYFQTIDRLELPGDARTQAFRRVVFNVAAANCDDHTKNLAFLCSELGEWSLAPAYDVTFAWNPNGQWTARHQMTVGGKSEGISLADLRELGDRFAVPDYKDALADVLSAVDRWNEFAEHAGLDEARRATIADAHRAHRPA